MKLTPIPPCPSTADPPPNDIRTKATLTQRDSSNATLPLSSSPSIFNTSVKLLFLPSSLPLGNCNGVTGALTAIPLCPPSFSPSDQLERFDSLRASEGEVAVVEREERERAWSAGGEEGELEEEPHERESRSDSAGDGGAGGIGIGDERSWSWSFIVVIVGGSWSFGRRRRRRYALRRDCCVTAGGKSVQVLEMHSQLSPVSPVGFEERNNARRTWSASEGLGGELSFRDSIFDSCPTTTK